MLFEGAPRFVDRLAVEPAQSWDELLERADTIARSMPEDEQIELLNAHPRIGADPATVSTVSYREQGYDRSPAAADSALADRLQRLNEEYEARFGFRFVVFVAGRPRQAIAEVMEGRMAASRDEELKRAVSDVLAIARSRLSRLAQTEVVG